MKNQITMKLSSNLNRKYAVLFVAVCILELRWKAKIARLVREYADYGVTSKAVHDNLWYWRKKALAKYATASLSDRERDLYAAKLAREKMARMRKSWPLVLKELDFDSIMDPTEPAKIDKQAV